ncbi:hypothetical protein DY000_02010651 [Brassica cretica]|uniref:Uncharacterized protein n=1 Tax=Brassica cretica TaxID=69181 RepID=A0ABQ7CCY7_BRACR|nr:hypothetical protein DY000_02010651 [Brassica cretica]
MLKKQSAYQHVNSYSNRISTVSSSPRFSRRRHDRAESHEDPAQTEGDPRHSPSGSPETANLILVSRNLKLIDLGSVGGGDLMIAIANPKRIVRVILMRKVRDNIVEGRLRVRGLGDLMIAMVNMKRVRVMIPMRKIGNYEEGQVLGRREDTVILMRAAMHRGGRSSQAMVPTREIGDEEQVRRRSEDIGVRAATLVLLGKNVAGQRAGGDGSGTDLKAKLEESVKEPELDEEEMNKF